MCTCKGKPTPLCAQCTEKHTSSDSLEDHAIISCKAFPYFTGPDYLLNLKTRQVRAREGRAKLTDTLEQMQRAQKQVMNHFEGLISEIRKLQQEKLSELRDMKKEVEAKINSVLTEVEEHIYENNYQSDTWLASAVWGDNVLPVKFQCFTLTCSDYAVLQGIKQSIYMHIDVTGRENRSEAILTIPTKDKLMKWDCKLRTPITPVPLSAQITVDSGSAWSETGDGHVFICGSESPLSATSYLIRIIDGAVTKLPPMKTPRFHHGLIVHNNEVCVFGGESQEILRACELFSFCMKKWTKLPYMNEPRSHCIPCRHEDRVFLAGGLGTTHVECFNWTARTFSQLQIEIPEELPSVGFVHNGELLVFQVTHCYRWTLESSKVKVTIIDSSLEFFYYACRPAVAFQARVYVLSLFQNAVVELKLPELAVLGIRSTGSDYQ